MAKAKRDPLLVEVTGTIGGFVFRKSRRGEAILSRRPRKSNTAPSEAQTAQRESFNLAIAYARAAMSDPAVRAVYEEMAVKEGKGAFAAAQSDYLKGIDLLARK